MVDKLQQPMRTQIVFVELQDNLLQDHFYELVPLVSPAKQKRIFRIKFDIDKKTNLYAELLVRMKICRTLNIKNHDINIEQNKYGKPYLQGYSVFQFNISHTRNAVVVAFSEKEVGIDTERIVLPDFEIAKRFFTHSEQIYIKNNVCPEHAFFEVWTRKEAYIKCIGTGLSTPLNSFNVFDVGIESTTCMFEVGEYIVSACCKEFSMEAPDFITVTENELQTYFEDYKRYFENV